MKFLLISCIFFFHVATILGYRVFIDLKPDDPKQHPDDSHHEHSLGVLSGKFEDIPEGEEIEEVEKPVDIKGKQPKKTGKPKDDKGKKPKQTVKPYDTKRRESGKLKARLQDLPQLPPQNRKGNLIISEHIPLFVADVNLTLNELKLFSGHLLNLVKARCPGVPSNKVDNIGKFISKLIATENPKPGQGPVANELANTLNECSAIRDTRTDTPNTPDADRFWRTYFRSYKPAEEKPAASADAKLSSQTGYYVPYLNTMLYDNEDGSSGSSSWNPFTWFGNIFQSIKNYMSKVFGGEGKSRKKRQAPTIAGVAVTKSDLFEDVIEKLKSHPMSGRDAFVHLFDNINRLYCVKQCGNGQADTYSRFKAAVKQLLEFIINNETAGIDSVAQTSIDNAFLMALTDCH